MNKKGFTLVELLAVIVVLGIIMTIAGSAVLSQKKKANIGEAKKIEDDIKTLGADVYMDKKAFGTYYIEDLVDYGLKSSTIKNPNGNGNCEGYLSIDEDLNFSGHICCPGLYETGEEDEPTDCSDYTKIKAK